MEVRESIHIRKVEKLRTFFVRGAGLNSIQVALYLAGEITQVKESIPWVRCASGNVLHQDCVRTFLFVCYRVPAKELNVINYLFQFPPIEIILIQVAKRIKCAL